eukprot:5406850-Alexandrium_andersonii.AAC.1
MSASLVGSEMCIRDRRPVARSVGALVTPGYFLVLQFPAAPNAAGSCPVSYTHLTLPTICSV